MVTRIAPPGQERTGWLFKCFDQFEQPPRLCRQWLLHNIFFLAQPPLLGGDDAHPNSSTPSMTTLTIKLPLPPRTISGVIRVMHR